ncbi:Hsp70 family protein [Rhodococcus sp. NPDC078407]|uniref:Hsp70 family protein n=1 Tax=Rhodococcus sp. NPDC078407 TaxID=3364509 RepID=UPI0037CAC756
MSADYGASVLGASLGSSGVRSVISNSARSGSVLEVHEPVASRPAPNGLAPDPWDAVVTSVHNLAGGHASAAFYPVLALRESNPRTAFDQDFSDGVVLVSELGAQLGALRETGVLAGEECVALFDVGASGTSVSVVDVHSGRVLATRRTDEFGGAVCDRVLCDHLIAVFGAAEALTVEARRRLVHDVRAGKHELSLFRSVSVPGPFVGGRATLWRGTLDELVADSVHYAVSMAVDVLDAVAAQGIRVDAVVAVGGGANMQIVRQVLFDAVSTPVYVPEQPELLAAHGAAGIARTVGRRPTPTTDDAITDRFAPVGRDSADREMVAAVPGSAVVSKSAVTSKRPRHSDTSSKRMTRVNKSRHLGGALAALVVVCAAGTVVAASARTATDDPAATVYTSQDPSPAVRSQPVAPASDGPLTASDGLPTPLTTSAGAVSSPPPALSTSSPTPATSSVAASTTSDAPPATAPRRTVESRDPGRTTSERTTVPTTTVVPPTTTRPPATTTRPPATTTRPPATTTRPPATTTRPPATTTSRPTTTTRSTRTFDFPFPNLDMPRG